MYLKLVVVPAATTYSNMLLLILELDREVLTTHAGSYVEHMDSLGTYIAKKMSVDSCDCDIEYTIVNANLRH